VIAYEIGITEGYFWDITPYFFSLLTANHKERQEQAFKTSWEQIRWQTAALLSPYSSKKMRPTDLVLFPWENVIEDKVEFELPENFEKLRAAMDNAATKEGLLK